MINKKDKGKEPEPIVVPPPPLDVPMASTSSPKLINIPSISDSEDLTKLTKENTEFNEADSSKYFPSRALYREYKVLDSNVAEWAKSTAVKLSASNKRVSFQIPYKLTFSDSSSDLANDPFYLPKKYSISKNPSFLVTLKMLTTSFINFTITSITSLILLTKKISLLRLFILPSISSKKLFFTISFFLRGGYIQAELLYHSMKYY